MKLSSLFGRVAAAAVLAGATMASQAVTIQYTLSGAYSAQWTLTTPVVPDDFAAGGYFTIYDVEGFADALLGVADVYFYNTAMDGGLGIEDLWGNTALMLADGPQLYSGPESSPTLLTGTFTLVETMGTRSYTLVAAEVPEPASVALLLGGLGVVGAVARRRRPAAQAVTA